MTGVSYPNSVAMSASYDPTTGRLAELAHSLGAADLARFLYAYNAVGSITGISEPAGTERSFGYDALQRLVSGDTVAAPESYSYDAEGNRLVSHLSAAHLTDAGNRLLQDDAFDYAYDDNGNLATKTDRATLEVTTYSYDAQDQLVRIDFPDGTFATYAYDALGRRIARDVDDGAGGREVTAYVYDGPDILIETDGTGALLARYAHGDRVDQPLAMRRAGQDYYLHADHQGSIVRVTDAAGAVVNSYEYDAYGRRLAATEGVALPYGYTGREFDAESGLMYYRARMYDPATGRFLQTDPLGFAAGDLNLYRYVFNNPVNARDPSGTISLSVGIEFDAFASVGGGASISVFLAVEGGVVTVGSLETVRGGLGVDFSAGLTAQIAEGGPADLAGTAISSEVDIGPFTVERGETASGADTFGLEFGPAATPIGFSTAVSFTCIRDRIDFDVGAALREVAHLVIPLIVSD